MTRRIYLRDSGGRRIFRRALPLDLVHRFGKVEFVRSLGSVPFEDAQRQARALVVATDELITMARKNPTLTEQELDDLARDSFAEIYQARRNAEAIIPTVDEAGRPRPAPKGRAPDARTRERRRNEVATAEGNIASGLREIYADDAAKALRERGITFEEGSEVQHQLTDRFARLYAEVARAEQRHAEGDFSYRPQDPLFDGLSTTPRKLPLLSVAAEKFRKDKIKDGKIKDETARANKEAVDLLIRCCGDRRIDRYRRADIERLLDKLRQLPRTHGKSPESRNADLDALIAQGAEAGARTLSPSTIFKHTSQLSEMFESFADKELIAKNPAKGVYAKPKPTGRAKDKTRSWEDGEVLKLFQSPVWTGARNKEHRSKPGDLIVRDELYWAPLLLAYHGARLNEICQLDLADIKKGNSKHGSLPYLNITDIPDDDEAPSSKSVKNPESRRKVPLHSAVIKLGFLEYVERLRKKGKTQVFPELKASKRGLFSGAVSKWFTRSGGYRDSIGLARDLKLHGLRHTAITKMKHANTDREIINQIVGHSGEGIGEKVYTDDRELPELKIAIEKIVYDGLGDEELEKLRALAEAATQPAAAATSKGGLTFRR